MEIHSALIVAASYRDSNMFLCKCLYANVPVQMSLCKIADAVFRLGPFAQACGIKHSLKTEVFINLRPMDSCVRQVEVIQLFGRRVD